MGVESSGQGDVGEQEDSSQHAAVGEPARAEVTSDIDSIIYCSIIYLSQLKYLQ